MSGPHLVVLSWRDRANPDSGGAEVFLAEVTAGLVERGWRVTQLSARFPGAAREEMVRGVRLVRRGGRLTVFLHAAAWHLLGRFGAHDVVLDVHNGMPFLSPLTSRRPVTVLVHHVHRAEWRLLFGPLLGRLGWALESRAAVRVYRGCAYVTVSEHSRSELVALGVPRDAVAVVPNGCVPPAAAASRSPTPLVCVLGRLVPHKRVDHAIAAVAELRRDLPDLRLAVVGSGDWEPQLRRAAATAEVADAVTFHGHLDDAARDAVLAAAWVLALPSVKEGWGLAVGEAAAQGTPAVAYRDAGGVAESIVDGATGLLAEDRDDFVACLRRLLTDAALRERLGAAARERSATFSWEVAAKALAERLVQSAARVPS